MEIKLNKEYIVSKISGFWALRRKLNKTGICLKDKIIFIKETQNSYTFKRNNENHKKRLSKHFLPYIKFVDSNNIDFEKKLNDDLSNIRVDVFRSDITTETKIFDKESSFKSNGYNFNVRYLPTLSSIYGEHYDNKKLRNDIISDFPDVFLGIIDYENLESDLYLVTQFIDMDAKIVLALRNYSQEKANVEKLDFDLLSKLIGIPIINYTETIEDDDLSSLNVIEELIKTHLEPESYVRHVHVNYGRNVESKISKLEKHLKRKIAWDFRIPPRYFAINLLEKDVLASKAHSQCVNCKKRKCISEKEISSLEKQFDKHIFSILKDARKSYVQGAITEITGDGQLNTRTKKLDKILLHKIWGIPIFLIFIAITFYSTFALGKFPMQWLQTGITQLTDYLQLKMSNSWLKDLLINGIIDGVGGVLIFLPNIFILFFFIGILENTSYLSRAAFLMDKYMHKIGLHGKSFVPMIMGFGCSVPAIMSTRIIESKRDRILTMMIVPFMSCSARLPVYILMISAFFPQYPVFMLFIVYLFGILLALIISKFFSKTILKQTEAPYVMELAPYSRPTVRISLGYMWNRGKEYLKKIAGIILIASIIIWTLGYFPRGKDNENSYIAKIGHFIEPAMRPLGFDWKMSVSILTGIAGKEITVSTMAVLYQSDPQSEHTSNLHEKLQAETYTSGEHSGEKVFNKAVALSFMFFILIYFPCIAVFATIWRESSKLKWAIFSVLYSTAIAWVVAFAIYQIGKLLII